MIARFDRLFDTLDEARFSPPPDLRRALEALPPAGTLPDPRETWGLFGLVDYGQRKRRAFQVLRTHLAPALGRQRGRPVPLEDVRARGIVPGLPEWEYRLGGYASALIHRPTGEEIHLDLINGQDVIWFTHFEDHLSRHRRPGPAQRRLLELYPACRALLMAWHGLYAAGLLHEIDATVFELSAAVWGRAEAIGSFLGAWDGATPGARVWLAAGVGDWAAAHEAAVAVGDPGLIDLTGRRAEAGRRLWLDRLRDDIEQMGLDFAHIWALADAGDEDIRRYLEAALREGDGATIPALELIGDDPSFAPLVFDRLLRDPGGEGIGSLLAGPYAAYLARVGYRTAEVVEALAARG